jgi:hypothetical protein
MKRVVYLAAAALVALLILVPAAMAQGTMMKEETMKMEKTMEEPLPKSGGPAVGSVLLPAAALLVGSGILAYAVLRRR